MIYALFEKIVTIYMIVFIELRLQIKKVNTGKTSDREMEALTVMGMDQTMKELSTYRADYMDAKSIAYQTITTTGKLSQSDLSLTNDDSLSKNLLNTFLVGSLLNSNIINVDYMLPITIENKKRRVNREVE